MQTRYRKKSRAKSKRLELINHTGSYGRKNRRAISNCQYTDEVTDLIVKHIAKMPEYKDCRITSMGPFGLGAHCTVSIRRNEEYVGSLTVTYGPSESGFGVFEYYDYSSPKKNTYPEGSIGDMNGLNYQTKPLPADIDEVISLVFKQQA